MMQLTEIPQPPLHHNTSPVFMMNNPTKQIQRTRPPWPGFPTSSKSLQGSSSGFGDANCMEQLLVHCANAIETNDATLAHQILWVLNTIAPPDGDSNQRLTSAFLRALILRASRIGCSKMLAAVASAASPNLSVSPHRFSAIDLAGFIDLTPWHRFGFTAANAAVLDAVDGFSVVHIVDLGLTHCMQIPTLLDAIAARSSHEAVPPLLKLTVAGAAEDVPPLLDLSYEEVGSKLVNFARSRNLVLEFRVVPSSCSDGFADLIEHLRLQQHQNQQNSEALVINCQMMVHHIPEETTLCSSPYAFESCSVRSMFLKALRSLDPTVVVLVDEDADLTSNNLVCRLRSAFNYLWIPYDSVDTFLPKGSQQRLWYEADICWKIQNVIATEGLQRVERIEPKCKWVQRMLHAGFACVSFGDDAVSEVKTMLDEHAAGWGFKREDQHLVLTWKGHNVVFATAWLCA